MKEHRQRLPCRGGGTALAVTEGLEEFLEFIGTQKKEHPPVNPSVSFADSSPTGEPLVVNDLCPYE